MEMNLKTSHGPIESLYYYQLNRVERVKRFIEEGLDVRHTTFVIDGREFQITPLDIACYFEHYAVPYTHVFEGKDDSCERHQKEVRKVEYEHLEENNQTA